MGGTAALHPPLSGCGEDKRDGKRPHDLCPTTRNQRTEEAPSLARFDSSPSQGAPHDALKKECRTLTTATGAGVAVQVVTSS